MTRFTVETRVKEEAKTVPTNSANVLCTAPGCLCSSAQHTTAMIDSSETSQVSEPPGATWASVARRLCAQSLLPTCPSGVMASRAFSPASLQACAVRN